MNKQALLEEKKKLEQQREQAIAQINQITGAIAMIDKMVAETKDETCEDCEVENES